MNNASSYALPVFVSLVLHGLLIFLLGYGWEARKPEYKPMPQYVQAKLVSAEALTPKKTTPPKVDLREQRRQRELERQRRAEAEKKRRAALERKKREEAERKKKAEEEKARREKERKERERREKERRERLERERQKAFEEALKEEEELLDARRDSQAVMSVAQAIQQRIESVLSWPPVRATVW